MSLEAMFYSFQFMTGCYGVSNVPSDGNWKCQRCLQEDQKAVESSVSRKAVSVSGTNVSTSPLRGL